ncbi:hypothetical protein FCV25MIE_34620 [Fagus crenata]
MTWGQLWDEVKSPGAQFIFSSGELGGGAAYARPILILHSFLLLFLCHFLEITKRMRFGKGVV